MKNVSFLPFKIFHLFILADMVRDAWHLEESIKSRFLLKMSCLAYSAHIISKSNYYYFLKSDNEIVSFLAARNEYKPRYFRFLYLFISFMSIFCMLFYKYGRRLLKYQLGYNKMLDELYEKAGKKYDAEMVLFITYTKYQSQGYGKKLVNKFNSDMKKKNIDMVYLFTDNYCDYEMYEKAGCHRVCEKGQEFLFTDDLFYQEVYLYEYEINKQLINK